MSPKQTFADVELRLRERNEHGYPVEITLNGEQEFQGGTLAPELPEPAAGLAGGGYDPGQLSRWFFGDQELRRHWDLVRGQHPQRRVRLRIDDGAPELHAIPWEQLLDSSDGAHLAAAAATPFSRYLACSWRPESPVLGRPLRLLVAIANPPGLKQYGLAPLDVAQEKAQLKPVLDELDAKVTWLTGDFSLVDLQRTLRNGLPDGGYHVLHFIGHGARSRSGERSLLYMGQPDSGEPSEDTEGGTVAVPAEELSTVLAETLTDTGPRHEDRLRLVFLASCHSALRSPADAFRGFAPQLVHAGVPAVLAMQDRVPVGTARQFTREFYGRLLDHGQVDLACNEARSAARAGKLPGSAVPVLYMRLRSGELLGSRGQLSVQGKLGTDRFWNELLQLFACWQCVPVLGPGVNQGLLDDPETVAEALLAGDPSYPMTDTRDLARVTQYLSLGGGYPVYQSYLNHLKSDLLRRLGVQLQGRQKLQLARQSLNQLISDHDWAERVLQLRGGTLFHTLAGLDLPLYLTTNADNFMVEALRQRLVQRMLDPRLDPYAGDGAVDGLVPLTELYAEQLERQRDRSALRRAVQVRQEGLRWEVDEGAPQFCLRPAPSVNQPVVFHLNGHAGQEQQRKNLVLSEDDFLAHLVRLRTRRDLMLPANVTQALSTHSLLFLGYDVGSWEFRVLLQGLLAGIHGSKDARWNIGVQLEVEGTRDRADVQGYLGRYMEKHRINIYWGTVQQFITDLQARWQEGIRE